MVVAWAVAASAASACPVVKVPAVTVVPGPALVSVTAAQAAAVRACRRWSPERMGRLA